MARRIQTRDAQQALGGAIRADVERAAGGNTLVSKTEAKDLHPFTRRAEAEVRAQKGAGARVKSDEVVDRAMSNAMAAWNRVNPPGGQDGRYLSKAEVAAIAAGDAALGELTRAAYARAGMGADPLEAVRRFFEDSAEPGALFRRNSGFGEEIDVRPGQPGRDGVPAPVLESFDAFQRAEAAGWATVTARTARIGGQDVWAVHTSTDGDPGHIELLTRAGQPLMSGRLRAGTFDRWDEFFGLGRFTGNIPNGGHPVTEGYSEDDERALFGQITSAWVPDVEVRDGTLGHDGTGIDSFATNTALTPEQRELALAALDLTFARTFQHRVDGPDDTIELGHRAQGTLRLGEHVDQRDGQRYLVADWKDIDDASFTYYFQRQPSGALKLAIEQFNN